MGRGPVITERAARLSSRDRANHPHADDKTCHLLKPHEPHPWGSILLGCDHGACYSEGGLWRCLECPYAWPEGEAAAAPTTSLAHWCEGKAA